MIITVPVSEGDQYSVSSISLSGNKVFSDDTIRKNFDGSEKPFSKGT
jgi:outer membrane protein assembly factor BamA